MLAAPPPRKLGRARNTRAYGRTPPEARRPSGRGRRARRRQAPMAQIEHQCHERVGVEAPIGLTSSLTTACTSELKRAGSVFFARSVGEPVAGWEDEEDDQGTADPDCSLWAREGDGSGDEVPHGPQQVCAGGNSKFLVRSV